MSQIVIQITGHRFRKKNITDFSKKTLTIGKQLVIYFSRFHIFYAYSLELCDLRDYCLIYVCKSARFFIPIVTITNYESANVIE